MLAIGDYPKQRALKVNIFSFNIKGFSVFFFFFVTLLKFVTIQIKGRVLGLNHSEYADTMYHLGMVIGIYLSYVYPVVIYYDLFLEETQTLCI